MWSRDQSFYFFLPIFLFFMFLLKCWIIIRNPRKNLPPSPLKLPIIGNLHQLGIVPHRSLRSLAQKHGPLMLLHFGSNPVLVVSSGDAAREIMKTNDLAFSNRPKSTITSKLLYDCKDVVFAPYGEYWRQIRSICMLDLLCSKRVQSFRAVREEETALLIEKITGSFCSASPSVVVINLSEMLAEHINNVVCRAVLGRKCDSSGGAGGGRKFKEILMEFVELVGGFNVGDCVPWLRWLGHLNGLYGRAEKVAKEIDAFLELVIQEHVEERERNGGGKVKGESRRDFVEVLLQIQGDEVAGFPLHKDTIKALILDMFIGGVDTTYATIEWSTMTELLKDLKSMKRLQNEVREIGRGKQAIIEDDLKKMPFLQAIIKEIMRLHPPGALIPRESTQNVKVMGYDITARTQVLINAWTIGRDPLVWDEPEEFKPERFLHSSIEFKGHHFELIPFGAGRRSCPGAQFSLAILQLAVANLMLMFDFALPARERAEELDMSETAGLVIHKKLPLLAAVTVHSY